MRKGVVRGTSTGMELISMNVSLNLRIVILLIQDFINKLRTKGNRKILKNFIGIIKKKKRYAKIKIKSTTLRQTREGKVNLVKGFYRYNFLSLCQE